MIHILKSKKNKMICNQVINHINYDINTTKTNYTKPLECKIPKGIKKKKRKRKCILKIPNSRTELAEESAKLKRDL